MRELLVRRRVDRVLIGLLIALAAGVAACATPANPNRSTAPATVGPQTSLGPGSASAIAESLTEAGLSCTNVSPREGATNVADEATCTIGEDDVIIRTFATPEDRDRYMEASGTFIGQLSFDVDAPPRIVGPTWIVTTDTRETAEKIRQILGGESGR